MARIVYRWSALMLVSVAAGHHSSGIRWQLQSKATFFSCYLFPELWCPEATVTNTSSQTCIYCTNTCMWYPDFSCYTTLAPSSTMDVTVPVSPTSSICDWPHLSWRLCATSTASHHSKLAFVVYLQILATALGVVGVFCIIGYRECTRARHK